MLLIVKQFQQFMVPLTSDLVHWAAADRKRLQPAGVRK